nr:hypothetical protein [Tanacetum cinerariifolium]
MMRLWLPVVVKLASINNADVNLNVNAPAEQAPAMAPPTRTDDQILPRSRWTHSRDALQITPVNNNNPFSSPSTPDALINFVNNLGYPKVVRTLSAVVNNDMFQLEDVGRIHPIYPFLRQRQKESGTAYSGKEESQSYYEFVDEGIPEREPRFVDEEANMKMAVEESLKSVHDAHRGPLPPMEPHVGDEEADVQRALEESMTSMYDVPRGPLPSVVIREPESGKYQPLLEVPGKGKEKVTEEQVARDLLNL